MRPHEINPRFFATPDQRKAQNDQIAAAESARQAQAAEHRRILDAAAARQRPAIAPEARAILDTYAEGGMSLHAQAEAMKAMGDVFGAAHLLATHSRQVTYGLARKREVEAEAARATATTTTDSNDPTDPPPSAA